MTTNVASLPPDRSPRGELTTPGPLSGQNAQLRGHWAKLAVERLAHGADAGIAETAVLRVCFGHNLREA